MDRAVQVVERAAERLRALEPDALAVLVAGSFARGTADEWSDLDLRALTRGAPETSYRTWFEERDDGRPLHVSAGAYSLADWLAERERPAGRALGFPARYEAAYVWATREAEGALGEWPGILHPPGDPQLEDFVESIAKVRRAGAAGDGVGVRLHARAAAELAPGLLRPLNEEVVVASRREAVAAGLALAVAPDGYRGHLELALGLAPATDAQVEEAALRLARALFAFLRERAPDVDPQPGVREALSSRLFERHLGFLE